MSLILNILHFNDVYRVTKQKTDDGEIDVSQWAAMLNKRREEWPERSDGKRDGLVLFSGDVFSPSVESSVTRGSHMVPLMNAIAPDCSVAGNHDFDWSAPHFLKLVKDSTYPWLLSNIIDSTTNKIPEGLRSFEVFERAGAKIGVVGLVEEDWIKTISSWPPNYEYRSMHDVAISLSEELRDPKGSYGCDIIIALTHSRVPNDIALAKCIHARSGPDHVGEHGCDLILGGHDHFYYVSKGVNTWSDYDVNERVLGAEEDDGVLVIKSGTDFRDLSDIQLELKDAPPGSVRTKYISAVHGARLTTKPGSESSPEITRMLSKLLESISGTMSKPVCLLEKVLDCRSELVRTEESAAGNWFADLLFHAYDDALCMQGKGGADAVFICGGTIRGDSKYGPGELTLGNVLEILPFQDPIVVQEMEGSVIWEALESAFEPWPAQEGRFPVLSGLRVEWDSTKPKGQRVLSVNILVNSHDHGSDDGAQIDRKTTEPVSREKGGQKYKIVTREYMATGFDGYAAFKGCPMLVDAENGKIMSDIVRQYLLGAQYINRMKGLTQAETPTHISPITDMIIQAAQKREAEHVIRHGKARWADIVRTKVLKFSKQSASNAFRVASAEHMQQVDCFDGAAIRGGEPRTVEEDQASKADLVTVSPTVDGRLRDVART